MRKEQIRKKEKPNQNHQGGKQREKTETRPRLSQTYSVRPENKPHGLFRIRGFALLLQFSFTFFRVWKIYIPSLKLKNFHPVGSNARNVSFETLYGGQLTLSTQLIKKKLSCYTSPPTHLLSFFRNLPPLFSFDLDCLLG